MIRWWRRRKRRREYERFLRDCEFWPQKFKDWVESYVREAL